MDDPADLGVLRALPARLRACGYVDAYLMYGVAHLRRGALQRELPTLDPALRPLVRLLALGEWVAQEALAPSLSGDEIAALERLGVLLRREDALALVGMVLVPVLGQPLFLPAPAGDPGIYFGEDTVALLSRMAPPRGGRALVLHAGPGAAALRAAASCEQVVAFEPDEVPRACAELNLILNGAEDRVDLVAAPPWPVPPEGRFDLIAVSPPLMPFPPEVLGRSVPQAAVLLDCLPEALSPGGVAQGVCADLGGDAGPRLLQRFGELARGGLAVSVAVASSAPLHPAAPSGLCQRLIQVAAAGAPAERRGEVAGRIAAYLGGEGITRLYCLCFTVSAGGPPGLRVSRQDTAGMGFWFR
jgi:hypothetical protein